MSALRLHADLAALRMRLALAKLALKYNPVSRVCRRANRAAGNGPAGAKAVWQQTNPESLRLLSVFPCMGSIRWIRRI